MTRPIRAIAVAMMLGMPSFAVDAAAQNASAARCADGNRVDQGACTVEAHLLELVEREGVESAMRTLDALVERDEDVRTEAHSYAHAIGIAAYDGSEPVGEVFALCTPAYQSGCYHGVIQSYFLGHMEREGSRLDGATVNGLCRSYRDDANARWLHFQCAHGMGHGLVMLADRQLPGALAGCDLVEDDWERESCYGGVFMENVVHATVPHHAVGRPQVEEGHADHGAAAAGGHDHHDHGAMATAPAAEAFPPLKADDPLYPCNVLESRYLPACYQMQTSAILHFNGRDVAGAARVCAGAPELYRTTCFQSLGRDISALTGQQHDRAITLCGTAPAALEPACHIGYAKNLIDLTADADDGFAYCRLLPSGESKRGCYVAVGEQIWVLTDSVEGRGEMCGAAESGYVADCRLGAGLPTELSLTRRAPRPGVG